MGALCYVTPQQTGTIHAELSSRTRWRTESPWPTLSASLVQRDHCPSLVPPTVSVQFSSVQSTRPIGSSGGHEGRFSRDPLSIFSAGGHRGQFWHRQGRPLFDVVHPAFPLLTMASPTLPGALKDVFWRDRLGPWRARTMRVSVSCQLPEEVPVGPQGSWSCSAPNRGSCAPNRRCGEVAHGLEILARIFFSESASRVHVWKPWRRMKMTIDLHYEVSLVLKSVEYLYLCGLSLSSSSVWTSEMHTSRVLLSAIFVNTTWVVPPPCAWFSSSVLE